jgi:uroporphyrinogen III methyltransferase/synthase
MSKVYLVGAGPGDPDLITWKGRKLLALADSVLYDNLANEHLLELTRRDCERIYVGKKKTVHAFPQEEICRMLIERARRGLTVVRLKGGDPFIFGRGGEELEALADAGVPFEVVPGVTSPLGIAAYSGVPLTHRDHTKLVTFVTGHDVAAIDWSKTGQSETLVIFMGIGAIHEIARELMKHGRSAATPAIAVRWGTRPDQETVTGTLADIAGRIDSAGLKPPATVIIGEVVALHSKLAWYEKLPLFGRRIVVTRAPDQAADFSEKLRALGADAIELPLISIQPPEDPAPLDQAIEKLASYHWLIFTSANGVRFFLDRLDRSPHDLRSLKAHICAIGPATRRAVESLHLKVDLMPAEYVAEGLVAAFAGEDLKGKRVLLPRAAVARDLIPVELSKLGAHIDVVEAYRNVVPPEANERAHTIFAASHKPDWITFTSSSTVNNLIAAADREALKGVRIASIGPVTSETARSHGLTVHAEAKQFTIDGLLEAILTHENLSDFARRYTAAWCSRNPASVAAYFAPRGSLKVNDAAPAAGRDAITEVARGFMTAFPDMQVLMDSLELRSGGAIYRWTLIGTNSGPGGTGNRVRISGYEEWRIGADGLIAESLGHFDEADYQRQLAGNASSA